MEKASVEKSIRRKKIFENQHFIEKNDLESVLNVSKFKVFMKQETSDIKSLDQLNEEESSSSEIEDEEEIKNLSNGREKNSGKQIGKNFEKINFTNFNQFIEELIISTSTEEIFGVEKVRKVVEKLLSNLQKLVNYINDDNFDKNSKITPKHLYFIAKEFDPKFSIPSYKPRGNLKLYGRKYKKFGKEEVRRQKIDEKEHKNMLANITFLSLIMITKSLNLELFTNRLKKDHNGIFDQFIFKKIFTKIMLNLYKINPDYNLYLEHLLVFKRVIHIQVKIIEFLASELFKNLNIRKVSPISNREFQFLRFLLVETRSICSFYSEFVLRFIQDIVRAFFLTIFFRILLIRRMDINWFMS